jgi:solute:Na+ symporter, SSS family
VCEVQQQYLELNTVKPQLVCPVPAAMFGLGAVNGFFAVPYTILIYPLAFVLLPRFWSVCTQHGYVTPADFVKGRFGSSTLALAVAFTGILATMPYIALQMFGIQVSLAALGIPTTHDIRNEMVETGSGRGK